MDTNDRRHDTQTRPHRNRSDHHGAPRLFGLPAVTLTLTPGGLAPMHFKVHARDYVEQQQLLARAELAWRIFEELAAELGDVAA